MTEEELIREFGDNGWYQLKDEIYNRYRFTPAKIEIEEHHVGVYSPKRTIISKRQTIRRICSVTVWSPLRC
ncbi:MAG: hypothetical protein V8R67_03465 [Eubacterium sp.]